MEALNKKIIGRLEYVDLPEFGLSSIVAKIDTGAYNGAIHTSFVAEKEEDGKKYIEFNLLDEDHPEYKKEIFRSDNFEKKLIKSSNGETEERYFIPTTLLINGVEVKVKLSLSNRKTLRYPILLGRKIIRKNFIVDVSKKFTK